MKQFSDSSSVPFIIQMSTQMLNSIFCSSPAHSDLGLSQFRRFWLYVYPFMDQHHLYWPIWSHGSLTLFS